MGLLNLWFPVLLPRGGIVNLTTFWQTGQHEKTNAQLPTAPFPLCNHQVRGSGFELILFSIENID